jgi:nucleoid-associated protein YgaU
MFFKGSRYATVGDNQITDARGRVVRYKNVRFIPSTVGQVAHTVSQGERLDRLAHQYYRDAERFWRIGDANHALWPDDLLAEAGRTLVIPPPEG